MRTVIFIGEALKAGAGRSNQIAPLVHIIRIRGHAALQDAPQAIYIAPILTVLSPAVSIKGAARGSIVLMFSQVKTPCTHAAIRGKVVALSVDAQNLTIFHDPGSIDVVIASVLTDNPASRLPFARRVEIHPTGCRLLPAAGPCTEHKRGCAGRFAALCRDPGSDRLTHNILRCLLRRGPFICRQHTAKAKGQNQEYTHHTGDNQNRTVTLHILSKPQIHIFSHFLSPRTSTKFRRCRRCRISRVVCHSHFCFSSRLEFY